MCCDTSLVAKLMEEPLLSGWSGKWGDLKSVRMLNFKGKEKSTMRNPAHGPVRWRQILSPRDQYFSERIII